MKLPLFPEPRPPSQHVLDLHHEPALDRANFLVSGSNRDALLWVERWPDWPGHVLALSGPAGCGKSHLVAIWRMIAEADAVSPSDLTEEAVAPLLALKRNLAMEDFSGTAVQSGFERALFHLYNGLRESGQFLLLADRVPPARWKVMLPDLKSRLTAMPCVTVASPDDELLTALFGKLFADRQVKVSPEVISYLLPRMERSFAAVNRLASRLDESALARGGAITVGVARAVLENDIKG